jgi:hypothetical protein
MEATVPSSSHPRARRPGRLDGLTVRLIEDPSPSDAELGQALRALARMMVRSYEARDDHQAADGASPSSSALTVSPNPRPDHDYDAA